MSLTEEDKKLASIDIIQRINFCIVKELMTKTASQVRKQTGKNSTNLTIEDVYKCLGINRTSYSKILNANREKAKNPTFIKELDVRPAKFRGYIIEILKGTDYFKLSKEMEITYDEWNTYFENYDKHGKKDNPILREKCKSLVDSYFSGRYRNDDKHEYTYAIIEWVKVAIECSNNEAEDMINKLMNQIKDVEIDLLTNASIDTLKSLRNLLTSRKLDVEAVIRIKEHIDKKKK